MPFHTSGAQRASSTSRIRLFILPLLALTLAIGSAAFQPQATAAASGVKVVIVVGPVEGSTSRYISNARSYAATARALGASVTEIYSPNASWSRVRAAATGANIFIYLGHGNGYPSPYGAFRASSKDGLGLNSSAGHGNYNVKYYGETYVKAYLKFDKNAVVLLNHLCYASGNSEPGRANPSRTVAATRVDYFAGGFLRAGARAVYATGKGSLTTTIRKLLTSGNTVGEIFQADPEFSGHIDFHFPSRRTSGFTVWMDPYAPARYYHSVVGRLTMTAATVRAGT